MLNMSNPEPPHLWRLEGTSFYMWRDAALRGAGFPVDGVLALADPDLASAAAASSGDPEQRRRFDELWHAAIARSMTTVRAFAADPRFREAVTWQNPSVVRTCLDAKSMRPRHELLIANYAQRYAAKNDTIGFFGPIGYARWRDGGQAVRVAQGPSLLARRAVFFEGWAIDVLAQTLSEDADVQPWLRPRLMGACLLDGAMLHRAYGPPVDLTRDQAALLARCDGARTVRTLADESSAPIDAVLAQLRQWRDAGLLHLSLEGPVEPRPETALRRGIEQIDDAAVRDRLQAAWNALESARLGVERAAGDAAKLSLAIGALNTTFERVTAHAPTRRHGETYAGRTLVYEDTVRDARVDLGTPLMERLAPPLTLVLDSARWLMDRAAERYEDLLHELFDRCRVRAGSDAVPFAALIGMATSHLATSGPPPPLVVDAGIEFQRRWARILAAPPGARRHAVSAAEIAPSVRREFPDRPPRWAASVNYSPDLMIAAEGAEALAAGDFTLILGELHLGRNTLDSRPFTEFHEDPASLLAAVDSDNGPRRIYHVPTKEWPPVGPRNYPSPLRTARAIYWCQHAATAGAPGPVIPLAALTVQRRGTRLVVRSRIDGAEYDVLEMLGEHLSFAVVNGMRMMAPAPHQPRVSIDRLVIHRETWAIDAHAIEWAAAPERADRFRLAEAWRQAHGMPRRLFYRGAGRGKPVLVDFASPALVELLARTIQRTAEGEPPRTVTLTEMLPDIHQTWLTDGGRARYTAELRCVIVDRRDLAGASGVQARANKSFVKSYE